jgi:uroporphyrinogen-III synthase
VTATGDGARPLDGRCVLVTRPRAQAAELIALLEAVGARVVVAPTVRIVPPIDPVPLQHAAANLAEFDWIVFSSGNAVDALLDAIPGGDTAQTEVLPKVAAVGIRTAARLRARGLDVAVVPDEFTAEGLVTAMTANATVAGARVLLPRSEIGRNVIAEGLRSAGAIVTEVIAYRTVDEAQGDEVAIVRQLIAEHRLDAITFTSGSAVQNFVRAYGPEVVGRIRDTVVAVIGPVTADVARQLGLPVQVQPATYTAADMVDALAQHFAADAESSARKRGRA